MEDLTEHTFIPMLTSEAKYNSALLTYGAVLVRRFEQGRPGVAGEYRPQIREGSANHATIYIRAKEGISPNVGELIEVKNEAGQWETWRVRGIKRPFGGVIEMLCEIKGSRAIDTGRDDTNVHRVSG